MPAIPRDTARRVLSVRRVGMEALAHAEGFVRDGTRTLAVTPHSTVGDGDRRVRHEGVMIQIGLRAFEVDLVWRRVERLQRMLRDGTLQIF